VLAIVFAVTSAFTTASKKAVTTQEWKVVPTNILLSAHGEFEESDYTVSTGYTDLVNERDDVESEFCSSETEYLCAAFIEDGTIEEDPDYIILGGRP